MVAVAEGLAPPPRRFSLLRAIRRNPTITFGAVLLVLLIAVAIVGPSFVGDPLKISTPNRLRVPSARFWFGTDQFGRDLFARTVWGARVSLIVGLSVASFASVLGLALGLACGYFRRVDSLLMRFMDGVMAIPSILLAIALITLTRPGLGIVIVAIVIPEVPRIVRVVRAVVLSIRSTPYIESAIAGGTRPVKLLWRHVLPNTLAPLIVQSTYVCASAMLIEAGLSFLGAGVPPEVPSWGQHHRPGPDLLPDRALDDPDPGRLPAAHRARGEPVG